MYAAVLCLVARSCPTLCDLMDCSLPGCSVHGVSPGKNTGVGCHAFLQGTSQPRDQTQVSCISGRFCTVWATREAQIYVWKWSSSVVSNSLRPHGLEPTRLLHRWDFPGKNTGVGCDFLLQDIFPTQDWTQISCIVGRCFTIWATREDRYMCMYN